MAITSNDDKWQWWVSLDRRWHCVLGAIMSDYPIGEYDEIEFTVVPPDWQTSKTKFSWHDEHNEKLGWLVHDKILDRDFMMPNIERLFEMTTIHASFLFYELGITDCYGFAPLTGLTRLELECNGICDISALGGLVHLQYLDLWGNQIQSVDCLSSLTELRELIIGFNPIDNIQMLLSLNNLQKLKIDKLDVDSAAYHQLTELKTLSPDCNVRVFE